MAGFPESPTKRNLREVHRRASDVSDGHRPTNPSDSSSSTPPSPTPKSPAPSIRAINISTAFERVHALSGPLQVALSRTSYESTATTKKRVKEFQDAVTDLFEELQNLPDNVPPTPALISAIQGCSFEVHCFSSSTDMFRVGLVGGWEERQREDLAVMLKGAMVSMCVLLELAAQAIEDAETERRRLERSVELNATKAERGSAFNRPTVDGRPLSWFLALSDNEYEPGKVELKRNTSQAGNPRKASLTNLEPSLQHESFPPSTPSQLVFSRKEPLIPRIRPSKGKYDVRHLRKSVHLHLEADLPPLRDSLAIIGYSAPFPTDLPKPDPDDLDAPYVEYDRDGGVNKANLRGLVGVITSGSATQHEEFVSMVLMTFRLFASGEKLADALYSRYTEQRPEWLVHKGKVQFEWCMAQARMKSRVATVLHLWLELHWKPEDSGSISRLEKLIGTIEEDCAFHARSLRLSLDRIAEDPDRYHGKRFRREERYKPTTASPPPTSFLARKDLADLSARDPSNLTVAQFTTPDGVEEFTRMITMVQSRYYRKLSPENFVHYKSQETQKIRKELGDFEQRYRAWIVWTIMTPEDPVERARSIEFWFEVAKTCVKYRNFSTAHHIACVLGDPEFEKMNITRQVLERLNKAAIYEFWKVFRLFENEGWWNEMSSSSLPAIPVSHILIRWRIYIEECGLRGLCRQTRDVCLPEFKSKGRIDVNSFLNLADLVWDIERTYEPYTFISVPWIESWFLAQVFAPHITDFGLETRHFKTGVAKDNPTPTVPDTVLAKLVAAFEARLQRKKAAELIPLVPRKNSVEIAKKTSANKLKKRPSALTIHSDQSQASSSRPVTPTSQNLDSQRQPKKLRKRSHDFGRASSESIHECLPIQLPPSPRPHMQVAVTKGEVLPASEVAFHRHASRGKLGPPPSPSHGMRFNDVGAPKRGISGKAVRVHPSQVGHLPPSPRTTGPPLHDWEII